MRVLDKKAGKIDNVRYNPALDNLPIPQIVLDKTEQARKTLEKNPFPKHLLGK